MEAKWSTRNELQNVTEPKHGLKMQEAKRAFKRARPSPGKAPASFVNDQSVKVIQHPTEEGLSPQDLYRHLEQISIQKSAQLAKMTSAQTMASPPGKSSRRIMKSPSPSKVTLSKVNLLTMPGLPAYLPQKHRMPNHDLATHFDSHTIFRQQADPATDSTTTFMLAPPGQQRVEPRQLNIPSEKTLKPQMKQSGQGPPEPRSPQYSQSQRPSDHITSLTAASKIYLNADASATPRSQFKAKGMQIHVASKSSFPGYSGRQPDVTQSSNREAAPQRLGLGSRDVPKTTEPVETGF